MNEDNQELVLGVSLTKQQKCVFDLVQHAQKPISMVEILALLRQDNPKANRMTIHRALDYLQEKELIHKITFNQTYTLCKQLHSHQQHNCQLLVCQKCKQQIEVHNHQVCLVIENLLREQQFVLKAPIEFIGICKNCQK